MGIIKKRLLVSGSIGKRESEVLFDTGASACFVREDIAKGITQILPLSNPLTFLLGNGTVLKAKLTTTLQVNIKGHPLAHMFLVVQKLPYEVIIGTDFLQRWKIKLDPATEEFIIDEKALEIVLVSLSSL
ncbi:MAG: retropepsin-like aspartic protease [bacterium]|nr:retropepsin-like aspartic protease [bacterium]